MGKSTNTMTKSVLITGASGGIGRALALEFQRRGLRVFATARSVSKMTDLADLPNTFVFALDVTSPADIAATVQHVEAETGGRLDYLVNNSGQQYFMPALDTDIDKAKGMFDVNFWAVLRMTQAFMPLLIPAKGTVVNIGSTAGVISPAFMSIYAASKAAVHTLDDVLTPELAPLGVGVLTVITGGVDTSILANGPPFKLPATSKYLPLEDPLSLRASGKGYEGFSKTAPQDYAKRVVQDILKGTTGKIWRGAYAGTVSVLQHILPASTKAALYLKGLDMDKLKSTA